MKNIIITGATGMVGSLLLQECISSSEIGNITSLVRKKTNKRHPKLKEILIDDFNF